MATTIANPLAMTIQTVASGTAAGSRTFTTTRPLRIFDAKILKDTTAVVGVACALTVASGGTTCITVTTPNPPVINTVYRPGNEIAASTINDAGMAVAAGGTIVVAVATLDTFDFTVMLFPTF